MARWLARFGKELNAWFPAISSTPTVSTATLPTPITEPNTASASWVSTGAWVYPAPTGTPSASRFACGSATTFTPVARASSRVPKVSTPESSPITSRIRPALRARGLVSVCTLEIGTSMPVSAAEPVENARRISSAPVSPCSPVANWASGRIS